MKLFFTLLTLVLFAQLTFSQEDGEFKKYYDNGQLKVEGQYLDKKKIGEWKSYYESGQLKSEYSYTKGKQNKEGVLYYENGILKAKTESLDGKYLSRGYYETGELYYERLLKDGYYKEFLVDNTLKIESNYSNNQLFGVWKQYYKNGNVEWSVEYKNGYREGSYKNYFENGQLKTEGELVEDKKNGNEIRYTEAGLIKWKGNYKNNSFNKTWTKFDSNGKKVERIKFKEGIILNIEDKMTLIPTEIPDGNLEHVPIYPGCENELGNLGKKNCMSSKIAYFVNSRFNTGLGHELNLKGKQRIFVIFKIDKSGSVFAVRARAPHPELEKEAIRVIKLLPRLEPGIQRGKEVIVPYSMPILFQTN